MILPVLKPLTLTRGVTFDYRFQWLQGVPTSALAQPLAGYTAAMAITDWQGATTYMTLHTGAVNGSSGIYFGGDQNDPSNGIIDIIIDSVDTATFAWPTARYNLSFTSPNGVTVTSLLYGQIVMFGFLP